MCASCVQRDNNKRLSADRRESKNKKREKKKKKKNEERCLRQVNRHHRLIPYFSSPIHYPRHHSLSLIFSLTHFLTFSLSLSLSLFLSRLLTPDFSYELTKNIIILFIFFLCVFSFVYLRRAVARHLNNRSINPPFFI